MTIRLDGVLPLSSINLGLAASIAGLSAEVDALTADLTGISAATEASLEVSVDLPPDVTSLGIAIGADLSLPEIEAQLSAGNLSASSVDISADFAADLPSLEAQISVLEGLQGQLAGGLDAGGISGFSYAGEARGFGPELGAQTRAGFGGLAPGDEVSAIIIATQGFSDWQTFSRGVATGAPDAPASSSERNLKAMGARSGADWNTGAAELLIRFEGLLDELRGKRSALEASARVAAAVDLPDPTVVLDAAETAFASMTVEALADNMVNVNADIDGAIEGVQADITAAASLSADISGQLSAGGFAVWGYTGRADSMGLELAGELANGVPGGSGGGAVIYGLVLAGTTPSMSLFGGIFKTTA